ncbi:5-hydroxytryptamine receptor 1A-like [Liolophura sinensis]|uniref:5-hydroxytryptamine receptor 1A-like n=1 Tax=Liolophura sinensis TaxID=3198878 RepID=UPI003158B877
MYVFSIYNVFFMLTLLGNLLVIIAVFSERRLRKVGNSFIVSLAISDLLVGCIVTPLALVYQLTRQWGLGTNVCDFWVSMDVICCTASILNLCVISFDRYNAITHPLQYALKRTPKRAFCLITFVWSYSLVIALPPFLGWREADRDPDQCSVSQEKGYTLYSTVGAFYLPLCVMMCLYWRVFQATQKRLKQWIPGPGSSKVIVSNRPSFGLKFPPVVSENRAKRTGRVASKLTAPINPYIGYRLKQNGDPSIYRSLEDLTPLRSEEKIPAEPQEPQKRLPLTAMQKRKQFFSRRMISFQLSTGTSSTLTTSSSNDVIVEIYKEINQRPNPALNRMRQSLKAIRRQESTNEATAALCRSVSPLISKKRHDDSSEEGESTESLRWEQFSSALSFKDSRIFAYSRQSPVVL